MEFLKDDSTFQWEGAEVIGEVVHAPPGLRAIVGIQQRLLREHEQNQSVNPLQADSFADWGPDEIAAYQALRSKRKKCIVSGCTAKSMPLARSYHQLPVRNLEVWQKWVEAIRWSKNDPEWIPATDQPLICSRHFVESDFVSYEGSTRSRLNHTAVPSSYLDPPEGTEMNPRFNDKDREPPQLSQAFAKYRENHARNAQGNHTQGTFPGMPQLTPAPNVIYGNDGGLGEYLEVTPSLNFEDDGQYEEEMGEGYYDSENYPDTEMAGGTEEDYSNETDNGYTTCNNQTQGYRGLYAGATEIAEYDEDSGGGADQEEYEDDDEYATSFQQPNQKPTASSLLFRARAAAAMQGQRQGVQVKREVNGSGYFNSGSSFNTTGNRLQSILKNSLDSSRKYTNGNGGNGGAFQGRKSAPSAFNARKVQMKATQFQQNGSGSGSSSYGNGNGSSNGNRFGGQSQQQQQKHKIGISKCKLIVEMIEEELGAQLKAIQERIAEDMDVPFKVVNGLWRMKDSIKKKAAAATAIKQEAFDS